MKKYLNPTHGTSFLKWFVMANIVRATFCCFSRWFLIKMNPFANAGAMPGGCGSMVVILEVIIH